MGVTEFESRDATFLENEFSRRGDVDQDLNLFEMEDQDDLLYQVKWETFVKIFRDHLILVGMKMMKVV